jgi:hypothetical protein
LVVAAAAALVTLAGCANKEKNKCLEDAKQYEAQKLTCAAMSNPTERKACTSKNEVRKVTFDDCNNAYN